MLSPMQKRHAKFKAEYPKFLILFRVGDFCQAFGDDATTLARVTGVALTVRTTLGGGGGHAMAGFPAAELEEKLKKLIVAGVRVAIADPAEGVTRA